MSPRYCAASGDEQIPSAQGPRALGGSLLGLHHVGFTLTRLTLSLWPTAPRSTAPAQPRFPLICRHTIDCLPSTHFGDEAASTCRNTVASEFSERHLSLTKTGKEFMNSFLECVHLSNRYWLTACYKPALTLGPWVQKNADTGRCTGAPTPTCQTCGCGLGIEISALRNPGSMRIGFLDARPCSGHLLRPSSTAGGMPWVDDTCSTEHALSSQVTGVLFLSPPRTLLEIQHPPHPMCFKPERTSMWSHPWWQQTRMSLHRTAATGQRFSNSGCWRGRTLFDLTVYSNIFPACILGQLKASYF